jgi:hypothetical protein
MAVTDTLGRVAAYAAPVFEDDDVKQAAQRAIRSARSATARKQPPAGRVQRAGEALRQAGMAVTNVGSARERRREEQRKQDKRRRRLAVLAGAGAVALIAASARMGGSGGGSADGSVVAPGQETG